MAVRVAEDVDVAVVLVVGDVAKVVISTASVGQLRSTEPSPSWHVHPEGTFAVDMS